ncbi:MAG: NrfD/PsrC family molybdoenzyme membrane anchor subunit, partial [Gemmatimonadales bacterium]
MSDTFFTAAPHWTWWIILYFFIGGTAGTTFMLAALLDGFGGSTSDASASSAPSASRVVRLGYYLAFIGVLISGFLLTVDLTQPLRFWHMLIENHTGKPMFKAWEPMSTGAW